MNNVILSTRNIDDLIDDVANRVVLRLANTIPSLHINTDVWMGVQELIKYLPEKPARPTLYKWVQDNTIPVHKKGRKLYFLKSEIDEWLKSGKIHMDSELEENAHKFLSPRKKAAI